jgi:hypothetical protein
MSQQANEKLRCTLCKSVKETYSEIVYSQGDRVCTDCKKLTLEGDKRAFDRDMSLRI